MRNLSVAATAAAAGALAACSTSPQIPAAVQAEQQLQQMLAGKVAGGPPTNCIPSHRAGGPSVITPNAIAFRVDPGTVYVSNTAGMGCESLAGSRHALVTQTPSASGLCRGDIVQVRDLQSGTMFGSCTLGEFVRYSAR